MIIAFTGKKGTGKTTAASILIDKGFSLVSFAEPLKSLTASFFKLDKELLLDPNTKNKDIFSIDLNIEVLSNLYTEAMLSFKLEEQPIRANFENFIKEHKHGLGTVTSPRQLLQVLGTEFFRALDTDFWLKASNLKRGANVVIDDLRFENEYKYVKNLGGRIIRVDRGTLDTKDEHESESLKGVGHEVLINNNIPIDDYLRKVQQAVDYLVFGLPV